MMYMDDVYIPGYSMMYITPSGFIYIYLSYDDELI